MRKEMRSRDPDRRGTSLMPEDLESLENLHSFYVRAVNYALSRDHDRRMEGLEVARGTGKITALLLIEAHPGIRSSTIAEATLRDRPSTSRIIAHLVDHDLIEQRVQSNERRAHGLYITDHGREVAQKVRAIAQQQSDDFFAPLSEEDKAHLLRITRNLYREIRKGGFK